MFQHGGRQGTDGRTAFVLLTKLPHKLPRSFYLRPTLTVARDLLGKHLVHKLRGVTLVGRIVEVEAYLGAKDAASHAFRGRSQRNDVMFWKGGHLYVYFTYGMHYCCNVVTGPEGNAGAVLLRGIEPIDGIETMMRNRGWRHRDVERWNTGVVEDWRFHEVTNGPAKLCQAFSIGRRQNGTDLLGRDIFITNGEHVPHSKIVAAPRIGIRTAIDKKWRFYLEGNPFVSRD
jgi:DNA-3-methyladenine glycosylase